MSQAVGSLGKRSKGKKPEGITRRAREADRLAEGQQTLSVFIPTIVNKRRDCQDVPQKKHDRLIGDAPRRSRRLSGCASLSQPCYTCFLKCDSPDDTIYELAKTVSDEQFKSILLTKLGGHGEWNYQIN
jgi:hypothetical protein